MSQLLTSSAVNITRPMPGTTEEIQVPPKAYLNFSFSLENATSAKQGDDLIIILQDGAVVVCLGYFRNTVEDGLPPIIVEGKELSMADLSAMFPNGEIEGFDLHGIPTGTEEGEKENEGQGKTLGENHEEALDNEHLVGVTQPGKTPANADNDGSGGGAGQQNAPQATHGEGQAGAQTGVRTGNSAAANALDGLRFYDAYNVALLEGINRLPGLDLSSNRGFENTEIWGGPSWEEVSPAPFIPPVALPPTPPTVFTPVTGLQEAGYNASGGAIGTASVTHAFTVDLANNVDVSSFKLNSSVFPGVTGTKMLEQGQTYDTQYGKFSFTVNKVAKLDAGGNPITNADGTPVYVAEITLKYSDLNNAADQVNGLALGAFLEEKLSFHVTGQSSAGSNVALGSYNISFVIEGSNDAPSLAGGIFSDAAGHFLAHAQVKEEGVYLGNTPTRAGTWDDFNAGTDAATHKNSVQFYLHGTDPDAGDVLSYSVTGIAANSGTTGITPTITALGGNSYAIKLNGEQCGTITFDSTGKAVFTLNNSASVIQKMNNGDVFSLKFNVNVKDQHGLTDSGSFDMEIHGTNDIPALMLPTTAQLTNPVDTSHNGAINATGTDAHREFALSESGSNTNHTTVTGSLTASDADNTLSELSFYIAKGDVSGKYTLTHGTDTVAFSGNSATYALQYGTLVLNKNGTFSYTENGCLGKGETGKDTFTVLVQDKNGAFYAKDITFTVNGEYNTIQFTDGANYVVSLVETGVLFGTNLDNTAENCTGSDANLEAKGVASGNVRILENGSAFFVDDDSPTNKTILFSLAAKTGTTSVMTTETINGEVWQVHTTTYGVLKLNTNTGDYTYTLNEAAVNPLGDKDTETEKFSLTITKGGVATTPRDFTVSIRGMNDRPEITRVETLRITEDTVTEAHGQAQASDLDAGAVLDYALVTGSGSKVTYIAGIYGGLELKADGSYTYKLDNTNPLTQALGRGQTVTETFNLRVTDENNAYDQKSITVTITGTYDAPKLSYSVNRVYEDGAENAVLPDDGNAHAVTGSLGLQTTDATHKTGYVFHAQYTGTVISSSVSGIYEIIETQYGILKFNTQDGSYTYTMNKATNTAMQSKNIGDILATEGFLVTGTFHNTDGVDSTSSTNLNIELKGSNDAPVFNTSLPGTDTSISITRTHPANAGPTTSSTVAADDIDNKDLQDTGVTEGTSELYFYFYVNGQIRQNISTTYGSVSINGKTGAYTYTLNNLHPDILGLTGSQHTEDTFTVWVKDPHGATANQEIRVTINGIDAGTGSNNNYDLPDVPLFVQEDSDKDITNRPSGGGTIEPGLTDNSGNGAISGNTPPIVRYCFSNGTAIMQSMVGTYGTIYIDSLTGKYEYVLNNEDSIVQKLAAGQVVTENFTVYTYNVTGSSITNPTATSYIIKVNVTGTNDAPELTVASAGDIHIFAGSANIVTSGTYSANDMDTTDTLHYSLADNASVTTITLAYGTVVLNGGTYTYTYGSTPITRPIQEKFWIYVTDGHETVGKEVTINLLPENAKPVLTGNIVDTTGYDGTDYAGNSFITSTTTYGNGAFSIDPITGAILYNNSPLPSTRNALQTHLNEATGDVAVKGQLSAWDYEVDTAGVQNASSYTYYLCKADGTGLTSFSANDYGTLQMNRDGTYVFTLNSAGDAVKALQEGVNYKLDFWVMLKDGSGLASDPQKLEITIHGTNNQPTISTSGGFAVTEGQNVDTSLALKLADPDFDYTSPNAGAKFAITCTDINDNTLGSVTNTGNLYTYTTKYGKFILDASDMAAIRYKFVLDNDSADVKALSANDNVALKFGIQFNDGQSQHNLSEKVELTVTVQGVETPPELTVKNYTSAAFAGIFDNDNTTNDILTAGKTISHTDQLLATDIDAKDPLVFSIVGENTGQLGGTLSATKAGQFTYSFQAGETGQTMAGFAEHFQVRVNDPTGGATGYDTAWLNVTYDNALNQLQFELSNDAPIL